MTALLWVGVVVLGGLGSFLRYWVDSLVSRRLGRTFPWGILVINVSGSFALGVVAGLALPPDVALLAGTATVGAYTTFSTWVLDIQRLAEERAWRATVGNLVFSVILGVAAVAAGLWVGGLFA